MDHPGFDSVSHDIAQKQGISEEHADAILASQGRKSSPAARKANPRLNLIRGKRGS